MDYEKKYKEALERAKAMIDDLRKGEDILAVSDIEAMFPELTKSEDERIREALIEALKTAKTVGELKFILPEPTREECIAYLEKQKERDLDIVPELRATAWGEGYQHGRKDTEEKYSGMMVCSPEEWNEAISDAFKHGMDEGEKQKEKKPNIELIQKSWYMEGYHDREFNNEPKWIIKTGEGGPKYEENPKYGQHIEKQDYSGLNDFERAIHRGFLCAGVENVPVNIIKETAQDCLAHLSVEWSDDFDKEVENVHKRYPEVSYAKLTRIAYHFSKWANRRKDIEWSEEDKAIVARIAVCLDGQLFITEEARKRCLEWFNKHRRDFLDSTSWKPSEEQMGQLKSAADLPEFGPMVTTRKQFPSLESLYNDLKKL